MKIKLLNAGKYPVLEGVKFPVEVDGQSWLGLGYDVVSSQLIPFGADPNYWGSAEIAYWQNHEVEVVE